MVVDVLSINMKMVYMYTFSKGSSDVARRSKILAANIIFSPTTGEPPPHCRTFAQASCLELWVKSFGLG